MNQYLTKNEIRKIQEMCFYDTSKSCAVAQLIIDTCQIVNASTYAKIKGKHRNTINQQKEKLTGVQIENRKFISLNQ